MPSHFEKIEDGKPVHFKRFLLGLAEVGVAPNWVDQIFSTVNVGKKRYKVSINPNRFDDYKAIKVKALGEQSRNDDRANAAKLGKSHSKSASGAFGLIHTSAHSITPFCFILDEGIPRELPELKKKLLLIENFELFLRYRDVLEIISKKQFSGKKYEMSAYDVMYTQGSMVLNKQFKPFLMQYDSIDCLFDLDFGGLIIYTTLAKTFNNLKFLYPKNPDQYMDEYGFHMDEKEVQKLTSLQKGPSLTKDVKGILRFLITNKVKLEQEVYLLPEFQEDRL